LATAPPQEEIRRAKREIRPDLHDAIREARFLIAQLSAQIRRFEHDDAAASRLYSIVARRVSYTLTFNVIRGVSR
jgi:hypothetical protein